MTDQAIIVSGETLRLLPERALFWEREGALIVADLHWGKAATFRAAGVPLPPGTTTDDLARLDRALARTGARRLFLLGDLFHAREGRRATATLAAAAAWRAGHRSLEVLLVRGNHDRTAGDPPAELGMTVVDAPHHIAPFALHHEAPRLVAAGYTLAGHLHPGFVVSGPGRQRERLACFVIGRRGALLPAFGSFTGTLAVEAAPDDRVFVIAGDAVIPVSPAAYR
jgi:DNA ligase-associated metallophosphoesterase